MNETNYPRNNDCTAKIHLHYVNDYESQQSKYTALPKFIPTDTEL